MLIASPLIVKRSPLNDAAATIKKEKNKTLS